MRSQALTTCRPGWISVLRKLLREEGLANEGLCPANSDLPANVSWGGRSRPPIRSREGLKGCSQR